jgi:uncharacterized protein (DUF1800 family)
MQTLSRGELWLRQMGQRSAATAALGVLAVLTAASAHATTGTVVEYYHPTIKHYFITAYPDEAAMLDAGNVIKGWVRTGGQFTVYTDPGPDRVPVCRFFGTPGKGPNSHFYTADANECAVVKQNPGWTYEAIAFYIPLPVNNACPVNTYPVWRSFFTDQISDVNHRFTADLTAHERMPRQKYDPEGLVMCAPVSDPELEADVVRLLEQATLGPTEATVQQTKAKGIAPWLDEQLAMNVTRYTQLPWFDPPKDPTLCSDDKSLPWTPEKWCALNKWSHVPVAWEFFRQSKSAPDQLRLRMAHVWHQILVNSAPGITYAMADFHQRLRDNVFGTFENLLLKYALSPQLGMFQNWVLNVPEYNGIKPNENFARELMQLFTIGVNALNEDGTTLLNASGQLIPTYGQADIENFARVLTGYAYPTRPGLAPGWWDNGYWYFIGDMIPFDQFHDQGPKTLLGGRLTLFGGGGAENEVRAGIHMLVDHPNTPPFIVKQMIQKTVTSSPTPEYIARVVAVFKNNGNGVRGDLAAVTRAILLDPEARGARKVDGEYGRLREPALLWTSMIRALDVTTDGVQPQGAGYVSGQNLFYFQTVFGYYPSDFTLSEGNVPAPEFGIFTSAEFLNRANQINDLLYNVDQPWAQGQYGWGPQGFAPNATGTPSPALTSFLPDAGNVDVLVERVNRLFLHGTMTADMRKTIVNAVSKLAPSDALRRVKLAINLTLASVDYQVQK